VASGGTTRAILEAVRDDVGLGSAMGMLDRTGGGQGSSHLDDLEGLLGVADLHPDPTGFEPWLRTLLGRPRAADGVLLSTIHRVKGREWDRVLLFGVSDGILPHRLAEDLEEERRVLHVGITRGHRRVVVLADRTRPSPFLAELAGTAPRRPAEPRVAAGRPADVQPLFKKADGGRKASGAKGAKAAVDAITAELDRPLKVLGGYEGTVASVDARGAVLRLDAGGTLTVRFGERVEHDGRKAPLGPPTALWGDAAAAEAELRAWRTERSKADGVPAYVVLSDAHLRGIALARPGDAAALAACDGIGPTKLDRYGDEILARLDQVTT
jgi:DNA helicase-2/ATP-dependent DNA helicase PcrA